MRGSLLFCFILLISHTSFASGFSKPVWGGARAIGLGGAFVGLADDATALYHNPAGMPHLEGDHLFFVGADALITDTDYTPTGGTVERAETEFLPVPSFAYVNNTLEVVSFGVGLFFPHGNGGTFDSPSANPIGNPQEGRLYSMEIIPTFAWKITPAISFGASLRIVRISSELEGFTFIDPASATIVDVVDDLQVDGWTFGGAFGVMIRPNDWLRIGANYRTQIKDDLDGDGNFATLGAFDATLTQTLPTLVTVGASAQINKMFLVSVQYGWERNSEVNNITIDTDLLGTAVLPQNWVDSHTLHFGAEIKPIQNLGILLGYAKDFNESIPDPVNNRVTGDVAAHEVSVGVNYALNQTLDATFTWNGRFGDREVPNNGTNLAPGNIEAFVNTLSLGIGITL